MHIGDLAAADAPNPSDVLTSSPSAAQPRPSLTRLQTSLLFGFVVGARWLFAADRRFFQISPDEPASLAMARRLSGGTRWDMSNNVTWRPGLATLLAPVMWITDSQTAVYRTGLAIGAVVAGFSAVVLARLAIRLTDFQPVAAAAVAGAIAVGPASLTASAHLWAEPLVTLAFLMTLTNLMRFYDRPGLPSGLAAVAWSVAGFTCHGRLLPLVAVAVVGTVGRLASDRAWRDAGILAAFGLGTYIASERYASWLIGQLWTAPNDRNSVGTVLRRLGDPIGIVGAAAGQIWYLLVSTLGVFGLGAVVLVRRSWSDDGQIARDARIVLASTVPLIGLSAAFMAGRDRVDHLIYGRYNDAVVWPVLVLGVAWLATVATQASRTADRRTVIVMGAIPAAMLLVAVVIDARYHALFDSSTGIAEMTAGVVPLLPDLTRVPVLRLTVGAIFGFVCVIVVARYVSSAIVRAAIAFVVLVVGGVRTHDLLGDQLNFAEASATVSEVSGGHNYLPAYRCSSAWCRNRSYPRFQQRRRATTPSSISGISPATSSVLPIAVTTQKTVGYSLRLTIRYSSHETPRSYGAIRSSPSHSGERRCRDRTTSSRYRRQVIVDDEVIDSSISTGSTSRSTASIAGSLSVGVATFLLGVARAGDEPFWLDEAVTALVVRRPFGGLVNVLYKQEAGMTSYYGALWVWARAFPSDFGLRAFSVLGGATAAALMFTIAARWFGHRTAWLASAMFVSNPFFLRYLTEVRTYSWTLTLALAFVFCVDRALSDPKSRFVVGAGLLAGLGVASHALFVLLPVVVLATAHICDRRLRAPRLGLLLAVAILTAAPTVPGMIFRRAQLNWLGKQSSNVYREQLLELGGGRTLFAALTVGVLLAVLFALRGDIQTWPLVTLAVPALMIPLITMCLSAVKFVFLARYMSPAFPGLILTAAVGFSRALDWFSERLRLPHGPIATGIAAAVAVFPFLAQHPFEDRARGDGVAEAVEFVTQRIDPSDRVLIEHERAVVLHFLGYRPDIDPAALAPRNDQLAPPRKPLPDYITELRRAPLIYLIYWEGWPVEAEVQDLVNRRRIDVEEHFGDTTVLVLKNG